MQIEQTAAARIAVLINATHRAHECAEKIAAFVRGEATFCEVPPALRESL